MWISTEVLNWHSNRGSSTFNDPEICKRAYEIWMHAETILSVPTDNLHLIDAICTLKRAMSQRLDILKNIYRFDLLQLNDKPTKTLEQLAYFGIVRPLILKKLIKVRNLVEHEDAMAPNQEICREFLDVIWYFLRSTDNLVKHPMNSFVLSIDEDGANYFLDLEINPEKGWEMLISGVIPYEMVSLEKKNNWIEIIPEDVEQIGELALEYDRKAEDYSLFKALLKGPELYVKELLKIYFIVVNFI